MKRLAEKRLAEELAAAVREVRAAASSLSPTTLLLTGPGALAAAEGVAAGAGRQLERVELGAVVSRYAGETGRNLDRLLAEAEAKGAILLLDEADALFGKRTEVKDSHDRYANQEVGYLLERLERYRGVVLVVTATEVPPGIAFRRVVRLPRRPWP